MGNNKKDTKTVSREPSAAEKAILDEVRDGAIEIWKRALSHEESHIINDDVIAFHIKEQHSQNAIINFLRSTIVERCAAILASNLKKIREDMEGGTNKSSS